MLAIGLDIGSSFVKGVLWDAVQGCVVAHASAPDTEMPIASPHPGWAEQSPDMWWEQTQAVIRRLMRSVPPETASAGRTVRSIGIGYQMHGLVLLDEALRPVRPSVIWCDSRAGEIGRELAEALGREEIEAGLLNEPGNFTVSKLAWVLRHEPHLAERIRWFMLPGDYIATRLTGRPSTTVCGLSEAMLWDFKDHAPHWRALELAGGRHDWLPPIVENPGAQGMLSDAAARELGFPPGVEVRLRAGDQPMNGFALAAGDDAWAASAGTSGVLYRVDGHMAADRSGVSNRFAHLGHTPDVPRIGTLFCLNGAGRAFAWLRGTLFAGTDYAQLNALAATAAPGCDGLWFLPFGNGSERMFDNQVVGAGWRGLDFNRHGAAHLARSVLEGIAFAFAEGMERLDRDLRPLPSIRAPHAGLFRSVEFTAILASLTGLPVTVLDTDGATGAAAGAATATATAAAIDSPSHANGSDLAPTAAAPAPVVRLVRPDPLLATPLRAAFARWKTLLPSEPSAPGRSAPTQPQT